MPNNTEVLVVNNISKSFKDYSSEWHRVLSWFNIFFKPKTEHKILKNISFNVSAGEVVGIVGQNGAGKSTLLKIITGTLKPTEGSVHVNGKISAILELGMGFNPDLTGRQNVYNTSGLMGYNKTQVDGVIHEIEVFAEIDEYFDEPIHTYSSGMQMRVAFAVATAFKPEILIIDEALSVGDAYFSHKSFNRIKELQKLGTTLLFVSHDRGAIQAICDKAILLEKGVIIKCAQPEEVMDFYNALIAEKENSKVTQIVKEDGKIQTISGSGEAKIEDIYILNENSEKIEYITVGENVSLHVKVKCYDDIEELVLGYMIKDKLGQAIYGTNTYHHKEIIYKAKKDDSYHFTFSFSMNIGVGSYSIAVAAHAHETHVESNYEWRDQALVFNVVNTSKQEFIGSSWIEPRLTIKRITNA